MSVRRGYWKCYSERRKKRNRESDQRQHVNSRSCPDTFQENELHWIVVLEFLYLLQRREENEMIGVVNDRFNALGREALLVER